MTELTLLRDRGRQSIESCGQRIDRTVFRDPNLVYEATSRASHAYGLFPRRPENRTRLFCRVCTLP